MKIDDDNLSSLTNLLSDTDELVRLHGKSAESNIGCIDSNTSELSIEKKNIFGLAYTNRKVWCALVLILETLCGQKCHLESYAIQTIFKCHTFFKIEI